MSLQDQVDPKILGLIDLLSFAVTELNELSDRPQRIETAFLKHFKRLGDGGDDSGSRYIQFYATLLWAHIRTDNNRPEDAVPLFDEARRMLEPDDDDYYLTASFQMSAMMKCGREVEALDMLVETVNLGLANGIGRNRFCDQFYSFGKTWLQQHIRDPRVRNTIVAFMVRFHDMSDAEAAELVDNNPDQAVETVTTLSQELTQ